MADRRCPDEGRCWHECGPSECFRVRACVPFSSHGGTGEWSEVEVATLGGPPSRPCVEDVLVGMGEESSDG